MLEILLLFLEIYKLRSIDIKNKIDFFTLRYISWNYKNSSYKELWIINHNYLGIYVTDDINMTRLVDVGFFIMISIIILSQIHRNFCFSAYYVNKMYITSKNKHNSLPYRSDVNQIKAFFGKCPNFRSNDNHLTFSSFRGNYIVIY